MTIDTSPAGLKQLREYYERPAMKGSDYSRTILALIDALEEAREARDKWREQFNWACDALEKARAEIDRLNNALLIEAQFNEALRMKSPAITPETTGEDKHEKATSNVRVGAWYE
jgi:hypothetical protein